MQLSLAEQWKSPILATMLENRHDDRIFLGFGVLHLGMSLAGVPFWTCPIRAITGIPCPGCGLTRATFDLFRGDVYSSIKTHAFAPFFVFAFALLIAVLVLPKEQGNSLIETIRGIELRTRLTPILLALLFFYWFLRILGFIPFPNIF